MVQDVTKLTELLEATFNTREVHALYFNFGLTVDQDRSKSELIEALLAFVAENNAMSELLQQPFVQLRLAPQSISAARIELIRLHTAINEQLEPAAVDQLCLSLKVQDAYVFGLTARDKIRELLLWASRRERIPELVQLCQELRRDFRWQGVAIPFPIVLPSQEVLDDEWLTEHLANEFTAQELCQLSFYIDLDPENLGLLVDKVETGDVPRIQRMLGDSGVDTQDITADTLKLLVQKLWVKEFVRYCKLTRKTAQVIVVCQYLKPTIFA